MFEFMKKLMMMQQTSFEEGNIFFIHQRVVFIPPQTIKYIIDLSKVITKPENIIYEAFRKSDYEFAANALKKFSIKEENLANFMRDIGGAAGWGNFHFEKFDSKNRMVDVKLTLKAPGSTPMLDFYSKSTKEEDHALRGLFAGGFAAVFNDKSMECVEINCVIKGDDYCRFLIMPRAEFLKLKNFSHVDQLDLNVSVETIFS